MGLTLLLTDSCTKEDDNTIRDADGNVYTSVTIGTQVWMVENLKTTKYNDGTGIPLVTDDVQWSNLATGAFCWYENNISNKDIYGALYNWHAVSTGNLCPIGWHVPTDAEWTTLTTYLGGESVAGGKLKETGTTHWTTPNTDATNEMGFTALPGGSLYNPVGAYDGNGGNGHWWSSNSNSILNAWIMVMFYGNASVAMGSFGKHGGCSVRCVKD